MQLLERAFGIAILRDRNQPSTLIRRHVSIVGTQSWKKAVVNEQDSDKTLESSEDEVTDYGRLSLVLNLVYHELSELSSTTRTSQYLATSPRITQFTISLIYLSYQPCLFFVLFVDQPSPLFRILGSKSGSPPGSCPRTATTVHTSCPHSSLRASKQKVFKMALLSWTSAGTCQTARATH